jgi:hypothetical protein
VIDDAFVFDGVAHPFNFEPKLTDTAKRKILGENLLRLHGMSRPV